MARPIAITIAAVVVAGGLVSTSGDRVEAAVASDFDPGYIISDENFYDGRALDGNSVQSFLLSKNSRCAAGSTCLFNYSQNTPSMPANRYCAAMTGITGESAASIIARVGAACNISQRALIVLLQKEQALVTATSPSRPAFDLATGFSCPDTAPCDPAFSGFFYQMYYAARQFQVYRANPGSFTYKARAANNILFNQNRACGSSPVYIANDATAGLYIYTPYQPNAAALANLSGTGDACSSYGNRNFWRLWTDWFGSPTGAPRSIARVAGDPTTYLLGVGRRYTFTSAEMLAQYSRFGPVIEVSRAQLDGYADGGAVQRAVVSSDGGVYLVEGAFKFRFTTCGQVRDFGMYCETLPRVTARQLSGLVSAGGLNNLVQLPDRSKWLMQDGGQRREVPDPSVLAQFGISSQVSGLSNYAIGWNQVGPPVVGSGLFTSGGSYRTNTRGGAYDLPPGSVTGPLAARAYRISAPSYERLPASSRPLPLRVVTDNRAFVLTDTGWLEVVASAYGGVSKFTQLPSGSWSGLPISRQPRPHFIREKSDPQIHLASNGYLQPMTTAQALWVSSTYGVDLRVWLAADGGLAGLDRQFDQPYSLVQVTGDPSVFLVSGGQRHKVPTPEILALYGSLGPVQPVARTELDRYRESSPVGRAVRASDGRAYLVDSGQRFRFTDCRHVADFGLNCDLLPLISTSQLSRLGDGGQLARLVRHQDGSTWFLQSGQRRQVPDSAVLAPYGVPPTTTALSNGPLSSLPVGPPVVGSGVVTDGRGNYRAVGSAGGFDLSPAAVAGLLGSSAKRLEPTSFVLVASEGALPLRVRADGRRLIAADGGWLDVGTGLYGPDSLFTSVPSRSWTGVPIVGTGPSAHFVRQRSADTVYLVSSGRLTVVRDAASLDWIVRTYGVENRVWTLADGSLAGITPSS